MRRFLWAVPFLFAALPAWAQLVAVTHGVPNGLSAGVWGVSATPTLDGLTLSGFPNGCLQVTGGVLSSTGIACGTGGGGGSGTVTSLSAGSGITLSPNPITSTGTISATGGGGGSGTVTSVGLTGPGGIFSVGGSPITTSGTMTLTVGGSTGGIPYFSSPSNMASSGVLTSGLPVLGGGSGSPPTSGTISGNTTKFVTQGAGSTVSGHQLVYDASGNAVDGGAPGSGGTVTSISQGTNLSFSSNPITTTGTINCPNFGSGTGGCVTPSGGGTTNFLRADGTWSAPAGGGSTTFTIAPGFTKTPGTQNTGAQTISNGDTLNQQLWIVPKTTTYNVAAADTGNFLIANGAGITFNVPAPSTSGTGYQFGSNGTNTYTLSTPSGVFQGCSGGGGASLSIAANVDVFITADGTNYHCTLAGSTGGGGSTTFTIAPGFTNTVGTQNTGAQTITNGSTLNLQLFPVSKTAGTYTVVAADSGNLLVASGSGVTFSVPAATAGRTFQFASDGANTYTITTGGAQMNGCFNQSGATSLVVGIGMDVILTGDGSNYHCTATGYPAQVISDTYLAGQDLNSCASKPCAAVMRTFATPHTITGISGTAEVLAGGTMTIDFYVAASGQQCGGASPGTRTKINTLPFDANASAGAVQSLGIASTTIPAGSKLCAVPVQTSALPTAGTGNFQVAFR